jgi:nucleoside-diphosphate-sugar epimerase
MFSLCLLLICLNEIRSAVVTSNPKSILLIGGTRFSGLYLWKELHSRGHQVTLFNRGKTALKPLPNESNEEFDKRIKDTKFIKGNRQVKEDLEKLSSEKFDVIYDMNGRDVTDTAPLADTFNGKVDQFIYMSSAGVYKKSPLMPHFEVDFY